MKDGWDKEIKFTGTPIDGTRRTDLPKQLLALDTFNVVARWSTVQFVAADWNDVPVKDAEGNLIGHTTNAQIDDQGNVQCDFRPAPTDMPEPIIVDVG